MVISACASQERCTEEQKGWFYETLLQTNSMLVDSYFIFVTDNFGGLVDQYNNGLYDIHGVYDYGARNEEAVKFCNATDITICNTPC